MLPSGALRSIWRFLNVGRVDGMQLVTRTLSSSYLLLCCCNILTHTLTKAVLRGKEMFRPRSLKNSLRILPPLFFRVPTPRASIPPQTFPFSPCLKLRTVSAFGLFHTRIGILHHQLPSSEFQFRFFAHFSPWLSPFPAGYVP